MSLKCIGVLIVLFISNFSFGQSIRSEKVSDFYEESCPQCSGYTVNKKAGSKEVKLFRNYHSLHEALVRMDLYDAMHFLRICAYLNDEVDNQIVAYKLALIRATLFDLLQLPNDALIHLNEARNKQLSSIKWQDYLTANLAKSYIELQDYETAFPILQDWYNSINDSTPRDILKTNYFNLGECYRQFDQLDSAMIFQRKSLELEILDNDSSGLVSSYMEIGNVFYNQFIDDSAKVYFKKAYDLSKEIYDIDLMRYTVLNMAIVEEGGGNFDLAIEYRKEYDAVRDSLDSRDRLWTIAKEEKDFAVNLKEKEITLIEKEKAIKVKQLQAKKRERNLYLFATIILILFLGVIVFLFKRSITKKKIIEGQRLKLEELNATKNRILSIIAHDLKSPVHHIVLNNKSLLSFSNGEGDEQEHKKLFESNVELGNRTYQLIDNLLNWALCQNDQFFFSKTKVPLKKTVDQVVYNFEPLFTQKKIQFKSDVDEDIQVNVDQNSLKIVLRNLLDNAMKFTHEGGDITIRSGGIEGDYAVLTVSDSGIGMSSKAIENSISNKIGQSNADTSGKASTGLGLNLCATILEKNDGELSIESKEEEGTTIKLKLKVYGEN